MRSKCLSLCGIVCVLLVASVAYGQGVGTSGDITGKVVDPSGAVVAKASVIAVDTAKGIQHVAATDDNGRYRFSGLPPAIYDITAQGQGLTSEVRKQVKVSLGETVVLDFHMGISAVSSQVVVSATAVEAPIVDVERASQ